MSKQKKLSHFTEQSVRLLAPGVGFEPTRPEGAQADSRAYSRHGPACKADCPVPGSGIPAKHATVLTTIFPFGTRSIAPKLDEEESRPNETSHGMFPEEL